MSEQSREIQTGGLSEVEKNPDQSARVPPSAFTLLISDDDAGVLSVLVRIFRRLGFQVIGTASPYETITICQEKTISLVISDIMKPGIDGLEMFKRLRSDEKTCHVPFVFVSARHWDEEKALGLGANGFLCKPVGADELKAMVRRVLPVLL